MQAADRCRDVRDRRGNGSFPQEGILLVFVLFVGIGWMIPMNVRADVLKVEGATGVHAFDFEPVRSNRVGLMHRRHVPRGFAALFDFGEERQVSMWMQDTYVPLDMFFIDSEGLVRRIEHYAMPFSTRPVLSGVPVRYVVEVAGGTAEELGIVPGDKFVIP